jgi:hypothetical protein
VYKMDKTIKYISIAVIAILACLYIIGLDNNLMDYDEGAIYLYPSMLVSMGYKPYVDFVYNQPPLMLYNYGSVLLSRFGSILCLISLSVFTFFIGKKFGVGYLAVVFLLSSPLIMHYGRLATGDISSMAIFSAFLAFVIYDFKGWKYMILLSIVALFTVLIKVMFFIPICFVYLFLIFRNERRYMFSVFGFVLLWLLYAFASPNMLHDTITGNVGGVLFFQNISYLVDSIGQFSYFSVFVIMFALYGLIVSFKRIFRNRERNMCILAIVLFSSLMISISYNWLSYRQYMYLIPVLSVFAAGGVRALNSKAFMIIVILVSLIIPLNEWNKSMLYDSASRDIANMIKQHTSYSDMIYTDQPMLAFLSNRHMPNTAMMWNGMGRLHKLSYSDVIRDIDGNSPKMVLLVTETPNDMDPPRIISTFGSAGASNIYDYLDSHYMGKTFVVRNYQHMTVWFDRG